MFSNLITFKITCGERQKGHSTVNLYVLIIACRHERQVIKLLPMVLYVLLAKYLVNLTSKVAKIGIPPRKGKGNQQSNIFIAQCKRCFAVNILSKIFNLECYFLIS